MADLIDSSLPVERQDIFDVMQVTRGTDLQTLVGADLVEVERGQQSKIHRHNRAETVLYFLGGKAEIVVADEVFGVNAGDRIRIGKGVFHGVRTPEASCTFLSVQIPPILDEATGVLDLEALEEPAGS